MPHGDVGIGAATDVGILARDPDLLGQRVVYLPVRDDHVRGVPGHVRLQVRDRLRDKTVRRKRPRKALIGEDDLECARIEAGDAAVRRRDVGSVPI